MGPRRNGGLKCAWYWTPDTACQVQVTLELAPGWAAWQARMQAAGYTYGRVNIAQACPASASSSFTSATVFSVSGGTFNGRVTLGCDYSQYYTVPALDTPWRFEWYSPAQQAWVAGGGQSPQAEALAAALPGLDVSEYEVALAAVSTVDLCLRSPLSRATPTLTASRTRSSTATRSFGRTST